MTDPKEVKLQLFAQAATLVAPIVAAAAAKISFAVDPTVQDANLRTLNLFAFEETQVLYNALSLAYADNTANQWPDPKVASATPVTAPKPAAPTAPVPAPGASLASAAQIAGTVATVASAVAGAIAAP